jgi:hypothetical protein
MSERPRLLVLDLLETYARERDVDVRLERSREREQWTCALTTNQHGGSLTARGRTAREAITRALAEAGVELPATS